MKKTTIAALGSSLTLALVLAFTLVLPASAQPWSDQMPGGGERNEEMRGERDGESMDQLHEQMGELGHSMMNGSQGAMHQGEDMHEMGDACDSDMMGDHHREMHSDGDMGAMHRLMGSHMRNGHHGDMHSNSSMGAMHGSMMDSAD